MRREPAQPVRLPRDCPFNPFAAEQYDALLEKERHLDQVLMTAVARDPQTPRHLLGAMEAAARASPMHGEHATFVRQAFFARDPSGRTFAERWIADGQSELSNDERVLARGKAQLRVALLEVRRIIDDRQFEAFDLLEPRAEALRIVERSIGATASRFDPFLAWIYPLPHFWRLSGSAIGFADVAPFPAGMVLDEVVRHLGGPPGLAARRFWLADNFERIDDVLHAVIHARRRDMFAAMDGCFGAATYELRRSVEDCVAELASVSGVATDPVAPEEKAEGWTAAFVWFEEGTASAALPGQRVRGRLLLKPQELRVEAFGGARLDELRASVERTLGQRVVFSRERRDDMAGKMLAHEPEPDLALVPPRLLENPTRFEMATSRLPGPPEGMSVEDYVAARKARQNERLLDESVPALRGRTPREAAQDPALRADLIEWGKGLVRRHDRENLTRGRTDDINALIRTLGLGEIDVPPPPLRAIPSDLAADTNEEEGDFEGDVLTNDDLDEDEFDDDEFDEDESGGRVTEWSAPPLPRAGLSHDEALERLQQSVEAFASADAAANEIEDAGLELFDDLWDLCDGRLTPDQFTVVEVFIAQVWFALVPRDEAPALRLDAMKAALTRQWVATEKVDLATAGALERLVADSPQPNLLEIVAVQLFHASNDGPDELRMPAQATFRAFVLLKVLIAELDHALRVPSRRRNA